MTPVTGPATTAGSTRSWSDRLSRRWIVTIGSIAFLAGPLIDALAGGPSILDFPHNGSGLVALVAPVIVDLESLSTRYARLRQSVGPRTLLRAVDARRLVCRRDWEDASRRLPSAPWDSYGAGALESWMDADRWLMSQPSTRPVSDGLLREIHCRAMRGHYFVGYERRRVRAALAGRRISRTLHDVILRHMVRGRRVYFSGVDHEQLVGVYRSDPLESFVHNGESFLPDGRRYLIPDELDRLRSNRFFRVDESSIVRIGPEKILGTVHYVAVHSVGENVRTVLENADRRLRRPSSPHRAVRTIVTLARDLLSIHPFIDGNGRTVRLLADHLLSCRGLPPCLYPNELDLLMTEDEAYHFTLRGMCAYVDEMEKAVTAGTTGTLGRTGSGGRGAAGRY